MRFPDLEKQIEQMKREITFLRKCSSSFEFLNYVDNLEKEYKNILHLLESAALPTETSYLETLNRVIKNYPEKA